MALATLTSPMKVSSSLTGVRNIILLLTSFVLVIFAGSAHGGVPIPGLQDGPTPFQWLFATGFSGGYNTFGSGTTAGAIGNYGRFVTGGASAPSHSYH